MKTFIAIGALIIVLVVVMFLGVKGSTDLTPPLEFGVIHPLDHVKGNVESPIIIVEYSDFQCPACRVYYGITKQLMVEFGDQISLVYRHFPLTSIHINAEFAARAAEAAGKQGKFWEMHDLLFEKQAEWSNQNDVESLFISYAKLLNISIEQFKADWRSAEVKNFVRAQKNHALKSGLTGTPSFFINGEQIQNPNSVEAFRVIIKEAIKNKM